MFVAAAIVAAGCYELIAPTINAQRFIQAVAAEDFERADAYFRDPADRFLAEYYEKHWRFKAVAGLTPWTFAQFVRGERRITLSVLWGDAGPIRGGNWIVVATRAGLHSPVTANTFGGFGGGGIAHFYPEPSNCST